MNSMFATRKRKRRSLTLTQKHQIVKMLDNNRSYKEIEQKFDVDAYNISKIKKKKLEIVENMTYLNGEMKRVAIKSKFEVINSFVIELIKKCNSQDIPVNGPVIRMIASKYAGEKKIEHFKASKGWLQKFFKKNDFVSKQVYGEQGQADSNSAREFIAQYKFLTKGYESKDIFNCDETGLFWRVLPNKTFIQNVATPKGKKISKERLTILFTVSAEGEKLKTLVIGKTKCPRALKKKDLNILNLKYTHSQAGWMTKEIFFNFYNDINNDMIISNRHILIICDNFFAHAIDNFSNINFLFLPPNTTSLIQPLDQGVIHSFKKHYKTALLNHIICSDGDLTQPLYKNIDLFTAFEQVFLAWNSVTSKTIMNCFKVLNSHNDNKNDDNNYNHNHNMNSNNGSRELNLLHLDDNHAFEDTLNYFFHQAKLDCPLTTDEFLHLEENYPLNNFESFEVIFQELMNSDQQEEKEKLKDEIDKDKMLKLINQLKQVNYQLTPNLSSLLLEYESKVKEEFNKNRFDL